MSTRSRMIGRANWFGSVPVHAGRLLKRWLRSPSLLGSMIGMPFIMVVMIDVLFSGMIEQFTGREVNMTGIAIMIGVSQAFTGALMGAGDTVHERHQGLPDRLATMPGPSSSGFVGRILAEGLRAFVSALVALLTGFLYGADYVNATSLILILVILFAIAVVAGAVGVMLGYLVDTPQGAITFAPLIMAAMFFNTAMMPREMYAKALRPLVDASPMTAVVQLVHDAVTGDFDGGHLIVFLAWFGGLLVLSVGVLLRKNLRRR